MSSDDLGVEALADISDGKIAYRSVGQGPPLLLLLPQSSGPRGTGELVSGLAQDFRIISYDQRGTGKSSPSTGSYAISQQAADAIELIDAIGLDKVGLVCHSTGCGIGLSMACEAPDRVAALVLAAPWSHGDRFLSTMQNLRISAANALDPEPYAHFNASLLFSPAYRRRFADEFANLAAQANDHPHQPEVIEQRLQAILAFDARPLLDRVRCRTLVTVARDDQLMPPWFAREISLGIANAELVELEAGGHMILETCSQDITALVAAFMKQSMLDAQSH
ncbi:MAG: alpha/beta fold hydrolase [Hyphomicrobiaceae bacterium]